MQNNANPKIQSQLKGREYDVPDNHVSLSVLAVTMLIERRKRTECIITIWALNVACSFEVLM